MRLGREVESLRAFVADDEDLAGVGRGFENGRTKPLDDIVNAEEEEEVGWEQGGSRRERVNGRACAGESEQCKDGVTKGQRIERTKKLIGARKAQGEEASNMRSLVQLDWTGPVSFFLAFLPLASPSRPPTCNRLTASHRTIALVVVFVVLSRGAQTRSTKEGNTSCHLDAARATVFVCALPRMPQRQPPSSFVHSFVFVLFSGFISRMLLYRVRGLMIQEREREECRVKRVI